MRHTQSAMDRQSEASEATPFGWVSDSLSLDMARCLNTPVSRESVQSLDGFPLHQMTSALYRDVGLLLAKPESRTRREIHICDILPACLRAAEIASGAPMLECEVSKFQISKPVVSELELFAFRRSPDIDFSRIKQALPKTQRISYMELVTGSSKIVVLGYPTEVPIVDTIDVLAHSKSLSLRHFSTRSYGSCSLLCFVGHIISPALAHTFATSFSARASYILRLATVISYECAAKGALPAEATSGFIGRISELKIKAINPMASEPWVVRVQVPSTPPVASERSYVQQISVSMRGNDGEFARMKLDVAWAKRLSHFRRSPQF
jgi:hypothetical protein